MVSLKHLVAVLALGTAVLAAPAVIDARPLTSASTPAHPAHPVKHKKHKHRKVHRKHGTHSSIKSKTSKPVTTKTGSRHHPFI